MQIPDLSTGNILEVGDYISPRNTLIFVAGSWGNVSQHFGTVELDRERVQRLIEHLQKMTLKFA